MKKFKTLFILITIAYSTMGKEKGENATKYAIDVSGMFSTLSQDLSSNGKMGTYLLPAIYAPGTIKFTNGSSIGGDGQFSCYFGNHHHFGAGIGFIYVIQNGQITLDGFHVEYKETDPKNYDYRQLVTANKLSESLTITGMSIPIVAKYRTNISEKLTFGIEAGLLVNLSESIKYDATASFDFEAIYKFANNGALVYDDAPIPDKHDWFIEIDRLTPAQTYEQTKLYFDTLRQKGYNVALDVQPTNKSGIVNYKSGSLGFIVRPDLAYNLADNIAVTLSGFLMTNTINNTPKDDYRIMDINGNYTSPLNAVTKINSLSYGISLGIRYSFGR